MHFLRELPCSWVPRGGILLHHDVINLLNLTVTCGAQKPVDLRNMGLKWVVFQTILGRTEVTCMAYERDISVGQGKNPGLQRESNP